MSRRKKKGVSRTRDAVVIPFPTRTPPADVVIEEETVTDDVTLEAALATAGCEECGGVVGNHDVDCPVPTLGDEPEVVEAEVIEDEDDYVTPEDPDEIVEAGGRWVWQPAGEPPDDETPVGMVAHKIVTMCRFAHKHQRLRESMPQRCCYSVLVTYARMPGPARSEQHWLAKEDSVVPHA